MKFHIVGTGEKVDDILKGYNLTLDELKNENKHIRIWNYLVPGTKLKIPVLSEAIVEDINEIEPFIEDYYPKIKIQEETYQYIEDEDLEEIIEEDNEEVLQKTTIEKEMNNEQKNEYTESSNKVEEIIKHKIEDNSERYDVYNNSNNCYYNDNANNNSNCINNNNNIVYRYVYPMPYYRPIIYVIPRR